MVHRKRPRLCRQPIGGADARHARHADAGRRRQPVSRAFDRRESRSLPPHARGRISRRRACAAPEDRHGQSERQHARSGDLPDPARVAPSHRRYLVHLSALRLHACDFGCAGAHHAFDLHARVPGSSAAVRLGDRKAGRWRHAPAAAAATVRVRPAQSDLRGAVETPADRARGAGSCRWLGRSADADAGRRAPPRLHAGRLSSVRRAHRRVQGRLLDRHERARGLHAR